MAYADRWHKRADAEPDGGHRAKLRGFGRETDREAGAFHARAVAAWRNR